MKDLLRITLRTHRHADCPHRNPAAGARSHMRSSRPACRSPLFRRSWGTGAALTSNWTRKLSRFSAPAISSNASIRIHAGKLPLLDFFLAYFPSQRAGDTIHSPQHCLPGSGWNPEENTRVTLSLPGHGPFPANRYVISKADRASWCCIGIGPMTAAWPASIGPSFIWSKTRFV